MVIKGEYYFGVKDWWAFFIMELSTLALSISNDNFFWQTLLAVIAFSCFWSIFEVFEQKKRVERG